MQNGATRIADSIKQGKEAQKKRQQKLDQKIKKKGIDLKKLLGEEEEEDQGEKGELPSKRQKVKEEQENPKEVAVEK